MKTSFVFAFLILFFGIHCCMAQSSPQMHVSAEASEDVIPDIIKIKVILSEADSKGELSIKELDSSFEKVLNLMGINAKTDVSVTGQFSKVDRKTASSYNCKNYQVVMHSVSDIDRFFILLHDNQITNAYINSYEYSKKTELEDKLRVDAIHKAQKTAESLAAAISQSVGPAIDIQSNCYVSNSDGVVYSKSLFDSNAVESSLHDVEIKKITITQSVSVDFELYPRTYRYPRAARYYYKKRYKASR